MNENLIELIVFPWFFAALIGFIYYQINKLSGYFSEIKLLVAHKNDALSTISQSLLEIKLQLKSQEEIIQSLKQGTVQTQSVNMSSKEKIVNNYERAKGLMQRGVHLDNDVLRNCDITEEELELLSETSAEQAVLEEV